MRTAFSISVGDLNGTPAASRWRRPHRRGAVTGTIDPQRPRSSARLFPDDDAAVAASRERLIGASMHRAYLRTGQRVVAVTVTLEIWDTEPPSPDQAMWDVGDEAGIACPSGQLMIQNTGNGSRRHRRGLRTGLDAPPPLQGRTPATARMAFHRRRARFLHYSSAAMAVFSRASCAATPSASAGVGALSSRPRSGISLMNTASRGTATANTIAQTNT
jgi:hypothetical protein